MIRAVFFDLDGTLYDRDACIVQMARKQFEVFHDELQGIDRDRFITRQVELDAHGHERVPALYRVLANELGLDPALAHRLESYFRANYHRLCRPTPDTLATLETLRTHALKLGIITNGPIVWQSRKVESMGIGSLFDAILISDAEGVKKPDSRIFTLALERCGVLASQSIFVGDHPDADIAGSRAAGLLPVWKETSYWNVPDDVMRITQLSEILPICLEGTSFQRL